MDTNNENVRTLINISSSMIVLIISAAVNFFLSPYIIKNVGEVANGFVQLANNFVTYASLITIALNSMANRFISISYHNNDHKKANVYYSSVFFTNIVIIIVLAIAFIYIVIKLENFIDIGNANVADVKLLFLFVFINFFLSQISNILNIFLFVLNKIYYTNLCTMITTIARAVLLLALFVIFDTKLYFVTLTSCLSTLFLIFVYILLKKKSDCSLILDIKYFQFQALSDLFVSGIWNTINQCGNILMTGMDLLFANWFINPVQMGVLAVAKTLPTYITQVAQSINTSITPGLLMYYTQSKKEYIRQIEKMMKISSLILVVPITVFVIFGYWFYLCWIPSLDAFQLAILSFLSVFGLIPLSGTQVLYNVFTIHNKLKINSISFFITGTLNIIIVLLFTKYTPYGVYAIAGVSVIMTILRNLLILIPYASYLLGLKWNYFYKNVFISMFCFVLTILVCLPIIFLNMMHSWIGLIFSVGIAILIAYPFCSILILGKKDTLEIIKRIMKRRKK